MLNNTKVEINDEVLSEDEIARKQSVIDGHKVAIQTLKKVECGKCVIECLTKAKEAIIQEWVTRGGNISIAHQMKREGFLEGFDSVIATLNKIAKSSLNRDIHLDYERK